MDGLIVQVIINGLVIGTFYALIGIGLNIIFGVMDVVNFAQGEFLMVGMYITYVLHVQFGLDPYLTLPVSAVVLFGLGALLQQFLVTPIVVRQLGHATHIFLTVAFMFFFQNIALMAFSADYYTVRVPYAREGVRFLGTLITVPRLISIAFAIAIAAAVFIFLKRTYLGRALRATAQNQEGARLVGIPIKRMYVFAFGTGLSLCGIAGTLLIPFFYVYPQIGNMMTPRAFVVVVLGGLGSIPGAFVGGLVLGLLETLGAFVAGPALKESVVFVTFILVLLVRRRFEMGRRGI